MKVLIVEKDLYNSVGGGQTIYRQIIESTPEVEFYYFEEKNITKYRYRKPKNAHSIKLLPRKKIELSMIPAPPSFIKNAIEEAHQYSRSVAGMTFDIIDQPDYLTIGSVLRLTLKSNKVTFKRILLSLHGNISTSIKLNWDRTKSENIYDLVHLEELQFKSSDGVYSISPYYMEEWIGKQHNLITFVDPICFIKSKITDEAFSNKKPDIYCIGRRERRKGNDIYTELVKWLSQRTYDKLYDIGDDDYSFNGISSSVLLEKIAKNREIVINHMSPINKEEMFSIYKRKSIILLPVRYDTLNLVALEALFSGCPVAISDKAGVCNYLDRYHPSLPYVKINMDNLYSSINKLQSLIDNYEYYRSRLKSFLQKFHSNEKQRKLNFLKIYQSFIDKEAKNNDSSFYLCEYKETKLQIRSIINRSIKLIPEQIVHNVKYLISSPYDYIHSRINSDNLRSIKEKLYPFNIIIKQNKKIKLLGKIDENCRGLLEYKKSLISASNNKIFSRCNFWRELSRIEAMLGNELNSATYQIRILRCLGSDNLGILNNTLSILNKYNYHEEATVLSLMYDKNNQAENSIYKYLHERKKNHSEYVEKKWELISDDRYSIKTKVSIIISIYDAAEKLIFFLTALKNQTLIKKNCVEIILIDSASPSNEYELFRRYQLENQLNAVYARSQQRETIQSAWNRGIKLSKSPYLVFLGVDETLYPDCLEILSDELDDNSKIDWVMANSLVTEVEPNGLFNRDIMVYDRTGGKKEHVYLETCYLSWVGGMYRKNIHERCGYYDETFKAAGDTEFKNRVLPFIKIKYIPKVLGLFLNYPDGQTTCSPTAEIEDLRAWYIHRTTDGYNYAFEERLLSDSIEMLSLALGYRKSYCKHMSCDIEYAISACMFIKQKDHEFKELFDDLLDMQSLIRDFEFSLKLKSPFINSLNFARVMKKFKCYENKHRAFFGDMELPITYNIFNDNRYEQHSNIW
ncbi:glycosyltransferase [Endozoicomonas sp. 2B-B]